MPDLRVARPDTIRTRLEAIRDRHVRDVLIGRPSFIYCDTCSGHPKWPCADYVDAVAALELLKNAERIDWTGREESSFAFDDGGDHVVVPDPERDAK